MGSKKINFYIGIALLIALVLMYVPIPFIQGRSIAAVLILASSIYLLVKNN